MSDTNTQTAETTTERKPPTLADIVREKTDDGKRIIDFFLDVMEDRIEGAELCHRIDAAKQLEKHKSKAAARFLDKYRGVSCGHSTGGRPDPADPCSAAERSLVAVTLNAPATLTRDFLTVLSGIDEFLMARLIRAQTADGVTVIEFLDDVMQDRNDGFKTHHRIAAAKELIVHIVRDEQPAPNTPVIPAKSLPRTRYGAGTHPAHPELVEGSELVAGSVHPEPVEGSVHPEPVEGSVHPELVAGSVHPELVEGSEPVAPAHTAVVPAPTAVVPAEAGTHPPVPVLSTVEGSAHPEPNSSVVPAKEPAEGPQDKARRTRTQRRRDGAARDAIRRKAPGSERIEEEKDEQHWYEPDPYGAPIDSTHPGRSPPR